MPTQQRITERGMAAGLRALNRFASSPVVDLLGLREPAERFLHGASKTTLRTAASAGRTFAAAQKLTRPARQPSAKPRALFDLTPTDEQQMLRDSVRAFALERLRSVAEKSDADCATPPELLQQANELGLTMVGVPEELGGAMEERSAITSVLLGEALARGDMGIAVACLAPAAASTAISLWGDADQQAQYLHEFVSEDVPAAALAVLEPRALFNPFHLTTSARRDGETTSSAGPSRSSLGPVMPSCSSSPRSSRSGDLRCSWSSRRARASASSPSRPWGSGPPRPAR